MKYKRSSDIFSDIRKEKGAMNEFLYESVENKEVREKLKDQLSWLNMQCDYYSENQTEANILVEKFNWVVSNFNDELHLKPEERFDFIDGVGS